MSFSVSMYNLWLPKNREMLIIFRDALAGLAGLEALQGMFGTRRGQQQCFQWFSFSFDMFSYFLWTATL